MSKCFTVVHRQRRCKWSNPKEAVAVNPASPLALAELISCVIANDYLHSLTSLLNTLPHIEPQGVIFSFLFSICEFSEVAVQFKKMQ